MVTPVSSPAGMMSIASCLPHVLKTFILLSFSYFTDTFDKASAVQCQDLFISNVSARPKPPVYVLN